MRTRWRARRSAASAVGRHDDDETAEVDRLHHLLRVERRRDSEPGSRLVGAVLVPGTHRDQRGPAASRFGQMELVACEPQPIARTRIGGDGR